jgi:hypothetical protein
MGSPRITGRQGREDRSDSLSPSKGLHGGLRVPQRLLGATFRMVGAMKQFTPIPELAAQLAGVDVLPEAFVRFVGRAEEAGGVPGARPGRG